MGQEGGGLINNEIAAGVGITASVVDKGDHIPLFAKVIDLYGFIFTLDDVAKLCGLVLVLFLIRDRYLTMKKERAANDTNNPEASTDNAKDKIR